MTDNFTPYSGLLGGILIGISTALLLFANGRIAGISGIVGGLLAPRRGELGWRFMFVAGLWIGALAFVFARGEPLRITLEASWPTMAVAGLLVGFGTRMGSGCTSGHGVCGIARFSKRSIVATLVFQLSAIITVLIKRHVLGA
ncbi:MAG: YeeE/YedE family protein [Gammaproteobacteria bacterium]|nr:YeeE/YedE family protein [Gammaproteobacteria bacterium]